MVLAKLCLWCQHTKIKNFKPLLEIKRDLRAMKAKRRAEDKQAWGRWGWQFSILPLMMLQLSKTEEQMYECMYVCIHACMYWFSYYRITEIARQIIGCSCSVKTFTSQIITSHALPVLIVDVSHFYFFLGIKISSFVCVPFTDEIYAHDISLCLFCNLEITGQ